MYRLSIEAFTLDEATGAAIKEAMNDISLIRSRLTLRQGGVRGAAEYYGSTGLPTADLLVVQVDGGPEEVLAQMETLSEHVSPGTQVVLVGNVNSIGFYRTVIDQGIGQYLLAPVSASDFMRSIRDVFGAEKARERGRVIAVVGAKGGVGASTIAHNVAWSLESAFKKPTAICDLDLTFGTVAINYNHDPRTGMRDALARANQSADIDEAYLERLFDKESDTLWLLASNPSLTADSMSLMSQEALERVLDVAIRMATYTVLDVPHAWTPAVAYALMLADETLIVSDPSIQGLRNTQLLFDSLAPNKPQGTHLRYVVNMVGVDKGTEVDAKEFSEAIGFAPVATIPWNPALFRAAGAYGQMIGDLKRGHKLVGTFDTIARRLAGGVAEEAEPKAEKSGGGFLSGLFGGGKNKKKG